MPLGLDRRGNSGRGRDGGEQTRVQSLHVTADSVECRGTESINVLMVSPVFP
jgi:hypothetical protein